MDQISSVKLLSSVESASTAENVSAVAFSDIMSMVGTMGLMLGVLVLTYYGTKFIARGYGTKNFASSNHGYIQILERRMISRDQGLLLIEFQEKILLLGVTATQMQVLDQVAKEDYEPMTPPPPMNMDFSKLLDKLRKNETSSEGDQS